MSQQGNNGNGNLRNYKLDQLFEWKGKIDDRLSSLEEKFNKCHLEAIIMQKDISDMKKIQEQNMKFWRRVSAVIIATVIAGIIAQILLG
jgi:hypothetical protein